MLSTPISVQIIQAHQYHAIQPTEHNIPLFLEIHCVLVLGPRYSIDIHVHVYVDYIQVK